MPEHLPVIEKIRREPLDPHFRAVCACGYKSEPGQYDEAKTARRRHKSAVLKDRVTR